MCGIAGVLNLNNRGKKESSMQLREVVEGMTNALQHRGPDSSGVWQDQEAGLAIGHRRLAILDLSEAGQQPMVSSTGRYVIVYNGELYNFQGLKRRLEEERFTFKGHSDTEVLLAAIEFWGLNTAIQKLSGMFAFALWDKQERVLHFCRDRFGKKPLYIGWSNGQLLFASELKAFHAHPDFKDRKEIDLDVLALFMRLSYIPAPHSIFKNVWCLPAGHRATLPLSGLENDQSLIQYFEPYFDLTSVINDQREDVQNVPTYEHAQDSLDHLLHKAVSKRLISDVPIGAFLSGGIDSSLVVALLQSEMSSPADTFSIGFEDPRYNEAEHAKAIAKHLGTQHHEFYVSVDDAKKLIPEMVDIYDEPFADASQIPTYMIAREARKDVTVVLTGDGGDEVFGGYKRHFDAPNVWNKIKFVPPFLRRLALKAVPENLKMQNLRFNRLNEIVGSSDLYDFYNDLTQQWHDAEALVKESNGIKRFWFDDHEMLSGARDQDLMMYWDMLSHLPDRMMVKTDRASMATSIEVRCPLLDGSVFQFAWSLPLHYKIQNGRGKAILRDLLGRYVPQDLYERPKQGFTPPLNGWLSGDLKGWAEDILFNDNSEVHRYFDQALIYKSWQNVLKGSEADTLRIWNVLTFCLWYERWMA